MMPKANAVRHPGATAARRPDRNESRKWRQKKELMLAGGREGVRRSSESQGGRKTGCKLNVSGAGMMMMMGGGESKRILRSPGITPGGCTSPVKVAVQIKIPSGKKKHQKKKQNAGRRSCTELDTGSPAVLSYAEPKLTTRGPDGSTQLRDVGSDNEAP